MSTYAVVVGIVITLGAHANSVGTQAAQAKPAQPAPAPAQAAMAPDVLDKLLAPVALYPDQLLTQMLLCTSNPPKLQELSGFLVRNAELTGSALQTAAEKAGFEPSFVVLALFPQVVNYMADNIAWTRELGKAFATDRKGVLDSVQRLRAEAKAVGTLKTTPQQKVETKPTAGGGEAIVIEPANPQVVYVPQYNPQVVYTQPSTTTVVVKEEDNSGEAAALGALVGFTAGIAIGAAMDNDYYYGPYGWHGGCCMYNDAFDDYWDEREDAREDFYEHRDDRREDIAENREDLAGERSDRAKNAQEQRTERANGTTQQQRSERATTAQQQRAERTGTSQAGATQTGATQQQRGERATAAQQQRAQGGTASVESRGSSGRSSSVDRSGTRSDAFSGYSSGSRERSASSRGSRSRGSRSGGGGRRR